MSHDINGVPYSEEDEKNTSEHLDKVPRIEGVELGGKKYQANNQLDDAARILDEVGGQVEYTAAESRRVL